MSDGFRSPYEIETPEGAEGWEEMYPYYLLFEPARRAEEEQRFWFYNGMHFPEPMPAFDMITAESCYLSIGLYQGRVFQIPTVLGIEHRVVNGYVYITSNEVTDPETIQQRLETFLPRIGFYYENWDTLVDRWQAEVDARIAELTTLEVPRLPELEDEQELIHDHKLGSNYRLMAAYDRCLHLYNELNQLHFELLLLAYGAYLTFFQFCQAAFPDMGLQVMTQMIAGYDTTMMRPDDELKAPRRNGARARCRRRLRRRAHARRGARRAAGRATRAARGSRISSRASTRGSSCRRATASTTTTARGRTICACPSRRSAATSHSCATAPSSTGRRSSCSPSATASPRNTASCSRRDDERRQFDEMLGLCRHVFPHAESHKFFIEHWGTSLFFNRLREVGAVLAEHGFFEDADDVFHLNIHEVHEALSDLGLAWAGGAPARGTVYWPPRVARRKEILARLAEWTPPPALGVVPEVINDPTVQLLWGVTADRLRAWASGAEAGVHGYAASPGVVEGVARVVRDVNEIGIGAAGRGARLLRDGAELGAGLPEDRRRRLRHRRDDVARRDHRARVRAPGRRRHGPRDEADQDGRPRPRRRRQRNRHDPRLTCTSSRSAQLDLEDVALVGGKSAHLGDLTQAGFPVPPGFAIPASAFDDVVQQHVDALIAGLDTDDVAALEQKAEHVRAVVESLDVPEEIARDVADGYRRLGEELELPDPPVAVRSSAVAEDAADASFAGMQSTYLWLRGADDVLAGVRRCWASYFNAEALAYRALHGGASGMSVAVQYMVDARVAGVMFTINPVTGDPSSIAIDASYGLGVTVVGGDVTPDSYLFSKVTARAGAQRDRGEGDRVRCSSGRRRHGPARGRRGTSGPPLPRARRGRPARGARPERRAALRTGAGSRVGDRPPPRRDLPAAGAARDGLVAEAEGRSRRERARRGRRHVHGRQAGPVSDGPELTPEDVREILRLVDEAGVEELELETPRFTVRFRRGEAPAEAHVEQADGLVDVTAPMIGTFFRAPSPGEAPFVEVGSAVEPETFVCIIEVMKLMSAVAAGVRGAVAEVCRANGETVEFGDVLFRVRPE